MSPAYPEARLPTRNPFNVYSADPEMPVLYTRVERRRLGLVTSQEPGMKQKHIMDQILAKNRRILIDTYVKQRFFTVILNKPATLRRSTLAFPSSIEEKFPK